MNLTQRVFHPTLNSWQDVPKADVDSWTEAGWKTTRPKHIDDADDPFVPVVGAKGSTAEPVVNNE